MRIRKQQPRKKEKEVLQEDIGFVDIWRLMNPNKTYYSHNQKLHLHLVI